MPSHIAKDEAISPEVPSGPACKSVPCVTTEKTIDTHNEHTGALIAYEDLKLSLKRGKSDHDLEQKITTGVAKIWKGRDAWKAGDYMLAREGYVEGLGLLLHLKKISACRLPALWRLIDQCLTEAEKMEAEVNGENDKLETSSRTSLCSSGSRCSSRADVQLSCKAPRRDEIAKQHDDRNAELVRERLLVPPPPATKINLASSSWLPSRASGYDRARTIPRPPPPVSKTSTNVDKSSGLNRKHRFVPPPPPPRVRTTSSSCALSHDSGYNRLRNIPPPPPPVAKPSVTKRWGQR